MAAPQSPEGAGKISDAILATVENFLDTCPMLESADVTIWPITTGENPTVKMMEVDVEDEKFLIVVKRVGG